MARVPGRDPVRAVCFKRSCRPCRFRTLRTARGRDHRTCGRSPTRTAGHRRPL